MAYRSQIHLRQRGVAGRSEVIAGIILSGGASRRMGTPKALLQFRGETFLDGLIRTFTAVCNPVIVVVGEHSDKIRSGIARSNDVLFALNPDPDRGMLSSLQCGLALVPPDAEAAMFLPVDHPHLELSTIQTLAARFLADHAPVTVPIYAGEHGHPVCIAHSLVTELLALPPQAKASDVIHRHVPQTVYVAVSDPAVVTDIDDPSAYAGLLAQHQ